MPRLVRENTLPSFQRAIDAGADGIELDVHATADGVVVVHHDAVLKEGPAIAALTLAELHAYDAAPGIPIPTLREVCNLVRDWVMLFVEIKGAGIEGAVLETLAGYGGEVAIHSFDHAMIERISQLEPDQRLGILFDEAPEAITDSMVAAGALDVWLHWPLVTASLVSEVHDAGGRVIPWTVNDQARARALAALGVDALCGDDVRMLETV